MRCTSWQAECRGGKNIKSKEISKPNNLNQYDVIFCYWSRQKLRNPLAHEKARPGRWLWMASCSIQSGLESCLHISSELNSNEQSPLLCPGVARVRLICAAGFQLLGLVLGTQCSVTFGSCQCSWYWAFPTLSRMCPQVHSTIGLKPTHSNGWSSKPFLGILPCLPGGGWVPSPLLLPQLPCQDQRQWSLEVFICPSIYDRCYRSVFSKVWSIAAF